MTISELYINSDKLLNKNVSVYGWVRNHRKQKGFGFIDFFDGSQFKSLQVVYDNETKDFEHVQKIRVGSAIKVDGILLQSEGKGQLFEIKAVTIELMGDCDDDYPIQPKRHSREFLREQSYLRPRTNLFQAVFKIRSVAAMAIHTYFQERGFVYVNTPIFTDSDCEGAGEMFQVTTLDLKNLEFTDDGAVDYTKDFFGKRVGLTVSGQLEGECFAHAFSRIYTFGPTFRAENSNTKIHACEFWQIEPEMAFCDFDELMQIEEEFLMFVITYVLEKCGDELKFLNAFVDSGLIEKLQRVVVSNSHRISHHDAIDLLQKANVRWEFKPVQGGDIAKEHEKYLTEYFNGPVFVTDWPRDIKSFYMKQNDDDATVRAVDYLVPGAGELMGGSQREEDYAKLIAEMDRRGMNKEQLRWYTNLRRFGTCVHSGFGMGFERLMIYLTGVDNIRDVIPFPRTPRNCLY